MVKNIEVEGCQVWTRIDLMNGVIGEGEGMRGMYGMEISTRPIKRSSPKWRLSFIHRNFKTDHPRTGFISIQLASCIIPILAFLRPHAEIEE